MSIHTSVSPSKHATGTLIVTAFVLTLTSCSPEKAEKIPPAGSVVAEQAAAYLQTQTDAGFFNGSVLIARGGITFFDGGFGWADAEKKIVNDVSTRFQIASISKTFTAALVLKLVEQGAIGLDEPLRAHLESCPETWNAITVHHLLTHTSGIPNHTEQPDFEINFGKPYSPEQILATIRDLPLTFKTGERYSYSNSNYLLLAMLVEKLTGHTFEDALREELLDPLELGGTGIVGSSGEGPPLAIGYLPDGMGLVKAPLVEPSWIHGAGSMYSTVGDLQKWVQALAEDRVVTAGTKQKMWQADKGPYGHGWQVLDLWPPAFGRPLVLHAGGLHGVATDLLYYPNEQVTIVILANLETSPMAAIARDLSAIVFGADYALPVVRHAVEVESAILDRHVGDYQLAPEVTFNVRREGVRLIVQATGQPADVAVPESPTRFFSRRTDAQITFIQDPAGQTTQLVLHQNGRDLTAPRLP